MTFAAVIAVGFVGGVGAIARFLLDGAVAGRVNGTFPYGTLVVNLSGTFVLGILVGAAVGGGAYRIAGTGLIGAFTTFSTWIFETHRLAEDGELSQAALNVGASLAVGLLVAWAGQQVGGLL